MTAELLRGVRQVADDERVSSVHFLFCTEAEKGVLARHQYLSRLSMQFHWHNRAERPFESFDDFLTTFRSRNRKQVRKERQTAAAHGLRFRTATGGELEPRRLAGAAHVLPRQHRAPRRHPLPQRTLLRGGARDAVAPAGGDAGVSGRRAGRRHINFEKGDASLRPLLGLPGRLPDAALRAVLLPADRARDRAPLHAVRGGRAGRAQAEARPAPAFTHSAHWIRHPALADAIASFIEREAVAVAEEARLYDQHSPFRDRVAGRDNSTSARARRRGYHPRRRR